MSTILIQMGEYGQGRYEKCTSFINICMSRTQQVNQENSGIDHPDRRESDSKQIGLLLLTLPSLILEEVASEMSVMHAH